MNGIVRQSPVAFDDRPAATETRDHWQVVLAYETEQDCEGMEPLVVDLSHCTRWDVQDADLDRLTPAGVAIPEIPGQCRLTAGVLVNRMNRTQAAVWHLSGRPMALPEENAYTETTEATLLVALLGPRIFELTEKLTNLDLADPSREPPFLFQGPLAHVPCQVVVMNRTGDVPGVLFTCSRGYGRDMSRAILNAGQVLGLQPAGERAFQRWLGQAAKM